MDGVSKTSKHGARKSRIESNNDGRSLYVGPSIISTAIYPIDFTLCRCMAEQYGLLRSMGSIS